MKTDKTTARRPARWLAEDGPSDDRTIRIRVSKDQRARLDAAARKFGHPLSTWMRELALAKADGEPNA